MEIYGKSFAFIQHTIRFLEFHNNVNKNDEHKKVQKTSRRPILHFIQKTQIWNEEKIGTGLKLLHNILSFCNI